MLLMILTEKKLLNVLRERIVNKQKKSKKFRVEKVIKRKSDKLYVKWKGYDNSFNS